MKKTNLPLTFGAALLLAPLTPTFAQSTWATVDEFIAGTSGISLGLAAVDPGVVFSAGAGNDLAGVQHAFVRRSLDGGQNWQTVCDLPNSATAMSMVVTVGRRSGLVFASATLRSPKDNGWNDWVTLRSADGGTTWTKVDMVSPPNWKANPNAVFEDPAGRVFVAGWMGDARNAEHFFIRRSLDGGTTWATVDDVAGPYPGGNLAAGMAATPAGIFVVGRLASVWTVRRSTNGGTGWTTVDSYQSVPGRTYMSWAKSIAADANGNLYVAGTAEFPVNKTFQNRWIIRKSSDGGATWRTVDDFLPGSNPDARAVTVDAFGKVFVTGSYTSASGGITANHWITRASPDGGATWTTTDDYIALGGALGAAAASDAAGNVFTAGKARTVLANPTAVVRKLAAP